MRIMHGYHSFGYRSYSATREPPYPASPTFSDPDGGLEQSRQRIDVMADDTKHAPQRDKFLSLEQDWEAEYWAKKFGVSRASLEEAVAAVGRSVANVRAYLK